MEEKSSTSSKSGSGRIALSTHGTQATFSELSYTYPLKILSPRVPKEGLAVAYLLSYGGGLVGGDQVRLDISVDSGAYLVLLTQGSTKVFKTRNNLHRDSPVSMETPATTLQQMTVRLSDGAALFLLPDPVTCFDSASYDQIQTFRLDHSASAVILDWVTSGRMSRGEEWDFSRYYSLNEIWIDGKRVARDATLLEDMPRDPISFGSALKDRMQPYSCYANVLLYGPLVHAVVEDILQTYSEISVFQMASPSDVIWSAGKAPLTQKGCVVRVAGRETEMVKNWLRTSLGGLRDIIGRDVYNTAFS